MRIHVSFRTGRVIGQIKVRFRFRLMVKTKESPFCPFHIFDRQNYRCAHTKHKYSGNITTYIPYYILHVDRIHLLLLFYLSCIYTYKTFCIYIIYMKHFFRSRYVCTALVCEAHSHAESQIHRFCYLFYFFTYSFQVGVIVVFGPRTNIIRNSRFHTVNPSRYSISDGGLMSIY